MVKLDGYELILGSSWTRSSDRSSCSVPVANSSRSTATMPSLFRR